jgi:hypothetical protein
LFGNKQGFYHRILFLISSIYSATSSVTVPVQRLTGLHLGPGGGGGGGGFVPQIKNSKNTKIIMIGCIFSSVVCFQKISFQPNTRDRISLLTPQKKFNETFIRGIVSFYNDT